MTGIAKPPIRKMKVKPLVVRYHYKLATVSDSQQARLMEKALWEWLSPLGVTLFAIGHESGRYDVMGDSGDNAMADVVLRDARAMAAKITRAC